jgi:recombination protein RecA
MPKFESAEEELDNEEKALEEALAADAKAPAKLTLKPSASAVPEPPKAPVVQMVPAVAMTKEQKDKLAKLNVLISKHEKDHGEGVVRRASDDYTFDDVEFVPTGVLPVDIALGGGIPRGKIIDLYGPEGSGKTTLALKAIAKFQERGLVGGYMDAEHALDRLRAGQLGAHLDQMPVWKPDWGEQALDMSVEAVNSGALDILVIDSVAALVPKAELDGDMGDQQMGVQARMIGKGLRKLKGAAQRSKCTIIFINQIRMKIGVVFGNPETTPGGKALPFFADVRIHITRKGQLKSGDMVIGQETRIKTTKNKLCPPHQEALFNVYYDGRGIDEIGAVVDTAMQMNVIQRNGNWYAIPLGSPDFEPMYHGLSLGQGRDKAIEFLQDQNKADLLALLRQIMTTKMLSVRKNALEQLAQEHRVGALKVEMITEDPNMKPKRNGRKSAKKSKKGK